MVAPATDPASHNSCNWCNSWEEKKTPESCASPPQLSASSKPAKPGSRSLPKAPQANEVCCFKPNNYPHLHHLRQPLSLSPSCRHGRPSSGYLFGSLWQATILAALRRAPVHPSSVNIRVHPWTFILIIRVNSCTFVEKYKRAQLAPIRGKMLAKNLRSPQPLTFDPAFPALGFPRRSFA